MFLAGRLPDTVPKTWWIGLGAAKRPTWQLTYDRTYHAGQPLTLSQGSSTMRTAVVLCLALAAVACDTGPPPPAETADVAPTFRPTVSIEEVMRYMIDPPADAIWESVVTIVTDDGIEEIVPETDEDWAALRGHAVTLLESTNLLLMDGRRVAMEGSVSELPGVDLEPEQIEAILAANRPAWMVLTAGLYDSGVQVLAAIDARDLDALLVAGDGLDLACENCHIQFWYPDLAGQTRAN